MIKNLIKSLLLACFIFSLFYLLGAFIQTTFDISKWSEPARVLIGSLGGFVALFVGAITFFVIDDTI